MAAIGKAALIVATVVVVGAAIVGTGGAATIAFAAGAKAAVSTVAVVKTAATVGATGFALYAISKSAQRMNDEIKSTSQHKGTPQNNQSQNKMFDEAVRRLKKNGINMTPDRINRLHHEISHYDYSLNEIVDEGMSMFGK